MSINAINTVFPLSPASGVQRDGIGGQTESSWEDFSVVLARQLKETDRIQKDANDLTKRALLGNAGVSLHEAQIASAQADLHLRLLVQVRNKALEVYKEIMSMPV
jgi:flagellar hook-basal body complex protein FliE